MLKRRRARVHGQRERTAGDAAVGKLYGERERGGREGNSAQGPRIKSGKVSTLQRRFGLQFQMFYFRYKSCWVQ
eukprot:511948-Rhodomonas_salina.4